MGTWVPPADALVLIDADMADASRLFPRQGAGAVASAGARGCRPEGFQQALGPRPGLQVQPPQPPRGPQLQEQRSTAAETSTRNMWLFSARLLICLGAFAALPVIRASSTDAWVIVLVPLTLPLVQWLAPAAYARWRSKVLGLSLLAGG